ncbi:prephenate dehydrogenase [Ferrimonas balearica]|uniref:prephenate dehydrogenase n=1 Tax=Ferrimonas balearica TaxID=44012 RepID=UPI001C9A1BAB|nr:prephenate dehydrogenase [Ferrimonas balearica]MBY5992268.1 prephenate dehydrogenase [Ferrimonas balearica]
MSFDTVIEQYRNSLQTAYRQAVDADAMLDAMQQEGQAKFSAIFREDAGFTSQANRFGPYVQELAQALTQFEAAPDAEALPQMVQQLELLLTTLHQLRQQLKGA